MADEVDKKVMEAAEAIVVAFDALRDARLALDDPRLSSQSEQQRAQGFSQAANRVENSARRAEEALRRSTVAAAAGRSKAAFTCYRLADGRFAGARAELRAAAREDEASGKAARLHVAVALIEQGLDATKDLIFNEQPTAESDGAGFIPLRSQRP